MKLKKQHSTNESTQVGEYVKKTTTFNGGELFWLFDASPEIQEEWDRRITCSVCFVKNFFLENGISIDAPYRVVMCSSFTEAKSLLYERSGGKFILQPNAASAVVGDSLYAEQRAKGTMDVHEYIHILMNSLREKRAQEKNEKIGQSLPMWFMEGMAQYVQGNKDEKDYFQLARELRFLPPVILKEMNIYTEKQWLEFGIMEQLVVTGNHPGLTACASFVKFLIEKEGVGFKNVWDLVYFKGNLSGFYKKIEELAGNNLYNILNNYLYYIDKPFFPKDQKVWGMPVAIVRDFRSEFAFENKEFEVLELWQNI